MELPVVDHGTSRAGRWLKERRLRLAVWIAVVEGLLVVFDVIPGWLALVVGAIVVLFYVIVGRSAATTRSRTRAGRRRCRRCSSRSSRSPHSFSARSRSSRSPSWRCWPSRFCSATGVKRGGTHGSPTSPLLSRLVGPTAAWPLGRMNRPPAYLALPLCDASSRRPMACARALRADAPAADTVSGSGAS